MKFSSICRQLHISSAYECSEVQRVHECLLPMLGGQCPHTSTHQDHFAGVAVHVASAVCVYLHLELGLSCPFTTAYLKALKNGTCFSLEHWCVLWLNTGCRVLTCLDLLNSNSLGLTTCMVSSQVSVALCQLRVKYPAAQLHALQVTFILQKMIWFKKGTKIMSNSRFSFLRSFCV